MMIVLLANVAADPPAETACLYRAENVVVPLIVTRYEPLPAMFRVVGPGDLPLPIAKLSDGSWFSPPVASKLMKQPLSFWRFPQLVVTVTST